MALLFFAVTYVLRLAHREKIKFREMAPRRVSEYIHQMPFIWVKVFEDGGQSVRDEIEENATALLSNYRGDALDKPSDCWLGNHRNHKDQKIEKSGLWNQ